MIVVVSTVLALVALACFIAGCWLWICVDKSGIRIKISARVLSALLFAASGTSFFALGLIFLTAIGPQQE